MGNLTIRELIGFQIKCDSMKIFVLLFKKEWKILMRILLLYPFGRCMESRGFYR